MLFVQIKDGTQQFCIDHRTLNQVISRDEFPIPIIDELLDKLKDAANLFNLELRLSCKQICTHEEDIQKTTSCTHEGHYEFSMIP